jgi:hypothetical protein
MDVIVNADGSVRCVYGEELPLSQLGRLNIRRASHVEPTADGEWTADLVPVNGPVLGPYTTRTEALSAEVQWLRDHWLVPESPVSKV